ncbi:hypothetical protein [Salibacterium lacus]|uniref:Coat protein n=1 Tax=Salibacterium lacus TaxID=1898109 RepID=A0ABW5SY19_9BACI
MAYTTFSGVEFDPEIFQEYMEELSPEPAAFIDSGIIRQDPGIQITDGNVTSVPFYKPLTGNAQNYDGTDITVNDIASGKQTAIVIGRANAWGSQDLAAELASKDPMMSIASKVTQYWREEWQRILILQLNGIFGASAFSTHVHDISIEDGDNATEDNKIGPDAIIDATQNTIGDNASKISAISVHSKVYARMQKLNLIEFEPYGDQNTVVPVFLGKRIIVDDAHTVEAGGTSGNKYTSYLFAPGSIGRADGSVKVPTATERQELSGGGREHLVNRQRRVYHLYGSHFTQSSLAGVSPTDAELSDGTNFDKVYEDKNIPVIKLVTNG